MAVEVVLGTPLAEAIQNAVQPKLVEQGWSTGGPDDSALAEYVILMLVNGKSQDAIASELSNDLLGLGPEDQSTIQFAQWLFEQVDALNTQLNGQAPPSAPAADAQVAQDEENNAAEQPQPTGDAEMGDSTGDPSIPTGPKSMRNGTQRGRDKRMLGQINKNLTGTGDAALHRVRGANGAGRINSHSREPPKGPRAQQVNRAMQMANGRPMPNPMGMNQPPMGFPQQQQMMGMAPGGPLNPSQQMQLLQMMEQQSQMMAQFMTAQSGGGGPGGPMFNPAFQNGMNAQGQQGKSLFERVEGRPPRRNNRPQNNQSHQESANNGTADPSSSMEVESSSQQPADPANTLCRFNLSCTNPQCSYAHQSPAAPPGVTVDMTDSCSFGAACRNFKCVAKHPSPAKKFAHQAEIQCSFWPNCTKPNCPFKHPAPLCHNGGDCVTPGCKFTHNTTMCKFNPCKNPNCMFKHAQGQKGIFRDKVWVADGAAGDGEEKEHVSDRKFVAEEGAAEELIIPGQSDSSQAQEMQQDTQVETQPETQITV